jgi:ADP-heptose:LPS heptosyltransferase
LIVPEPGILRALCAEPAIRRYGQQQKDIEITVCHPYADLFASHPAVQTVAYSMKDAEQVHYDRQIQLHAGNDKGTIMEWMQNYGIQLGVEVENPRPKIEMSSFDLVRVQRFGLSRLSSPRIAVAIAADGMDDADPERWCNMCSFLSDQMKAGIVLIGYGGPVKMEAELDLRGRLMAREMAAVISRCDILISDDPEMIWMAGSVQVPAIFLGSQSMADVTCPQDQHLWIQTDGPEDVLEAISRLGQCYDRNNQSDSVMES